MWIVYKHKRERLRGVTPKVAIDNLVCLSEKSDAKPAGNVSGNSQRADRSGD